MDRTSFVLQADGRTLRSPDLIGAEIELGEGHVLRIDAVRADPNDPEILLHSFSAREPGGDWYNPCGADAQGRQEGFPLPGRWDDKGRFHASGDYVAFTCTSGAQAKCIRFGYKPWRSSDDGRSLHPLYESCVRMVRADYCGDDRATTLTGTMIDIYDDHGVQRSESKQAKQSKPVEDATDFLFEAGWTPDGAVCVNHTRIPANLSLEDLVQRCPRLAGAVGKHCDENEARRRGALVFNRSR